MSTAIAMAPSPAPHDRPTFSSNSAAASAQSTSASAAELSAAAAAVAAVSSPAAQRIVSAASPMAAQRSDSRSPRGGAQNTAQRSSPPSASRNHAPPKIVVKTEPGSPEPTGRHRPRRLDLSKGSAAAGSPNTARPLTARDGLGIQEVGLACLSPGFVTHDPAMKEQLQRSMSVRDQQRHIIEARLQQQSAKGDGNMDTSNRDRDGPSFAAKTPGMSRRNKAPPGLSIVAPSHETFAHERVIQSAPLGQTFTGMHNPHPLTRHITNQPSKLSNTSHIHHVPANQTNNRLPPIADVFGQGLSAHPESTGHQLYAQHSNARGPLTSPGQPPQTMSHPPHPPPPQHQHQHQQQPHQQQGPLSARPREYRSAEEAQVELAGGRPELLPKLVHYGGHQPPTPPSPQAGYASRNTDGVRSSSRRRTRAEYEDGGSPPLGSGRPAQRRGPFGEGRDSPETQRAKREEFLRLCERAWDLFHS